jgi:hypothetical protein
MRRYRARRREAGLRLERRWVADPRSGTRSPWSDHRVLDARSLAMHCLVARKIARHPTLLDRARENLSRWSTGVDGAPPRYLDEWRRILERPWPEIAALITGLDEQSFRLRQSSPFAGILSPAERRRIYEAFRA